MRSKKELKQRAEAQNRYHQTSKGKVAHERARKAYRLRWPEKRIAQTAVYRAIRKGTLVRPDACEECGTEGKTEAAHESYEPDRRLDVTFLCKACHQRKDGGRF